MKSNQLYQKKQEKQFEENLSFQEWLDYYSKELDDMEKESKDKRRFTYPINNPY